MTISPNALLALIGIASFGLLLVPAALRRQQRRDLMVLLTSYLALGMVYHIATAANFLGLSTPVFYWIRDAGYVLWMLNFGAMTLAFLRYTRWLQVYLSLAVIIFALWQIGYSNLFGATAIVQNAVGNTFNQAAQLQAFITGLWLFITFLTLFSLYKSFQNHPQAQYRNRYRYWLGGILFFTGGNAIILSLPEVWWWLGSATNLVGSLLITYNIFRSHPPELSIVAGRLLKNGAITITFAIIIFTALSSAYLLNFLGIDTRLALVMLIAVSAVLALLLPTVTMWIDKNLARVLFGGTFDPQTALQLYHQQVKAEHDPDKLARQALKFLLQSLKLDAGVMLLNRSARVNETSLTSVACVGMTVPEPYAFANTNPWLETLQKQPLTQYDLDVLPALEKITVKDRAWLSSLNIDTFFPIILRNQTLIGVLGLGPKANHRAFLKQEIDLVQTINAQIAADMDKAKLFNRLGDANRQLTVISAELDNLDRGKSDFLSIASHELRTPLTQIQGFTSMLASVQDADLEDPAYLDTIFSGIARGGARLKKVVDLIMDVSKADIGALRIEAQPLSLKEVIDTAAHLQSDGLTTRDHQLIVSGVDTLPHINGDVRRLSQAVAEVLNNAIKFTPDNGTITIVGKIAEWAPDDDLPTAVELTITDTGIGIDPEVQTKIFDKFYRVDAVENHSTGSVKFKGAGPGLGLSLAVGIVHAHGGKIWVESPEQNEETCPGSQFHIKLPVDVPETQAEPLKSSKRPSEAETKHWSQQDKALIKAKAAEAEQNTSEQTQ